MTDGSDLFEVPYLNFEPRSQSFRTPETKLFQVFSLRRKVWESIRFGYEMVNELPKL